MRGTLAAVVELRARLFWRRLTARTGVAEGVSRALLIAIAIPAGLAAAVGLGAATHQVTRVGRGVVVMVGVPAMLFGLWQTWTATSLAIDDREGLDLRRFLVYPVPPGRLHALGVASGLVGDPVTTFWGVALLGILVGAALARPGPWLLLLALALLLFAAATVALVALVQEALATLLESRRAREWGAVASMALGIAFLVLLAWIVDRGMGGSVRRPWQSLRAMVPALQVAQWLAWPAAFASAAVRALVEGRNWDALPWMAGEAAATVATGWLSFRLALRRALSGGGGGARIARRWDSALSPRGGGATSALIEKEAKYLLRHPLARMDAILVPAVAALVAWRVSDRAGRPDLEVGSEMVRALPMLALGAYVHLAVQPFWMNAFGWERGGARLLFMAPLDLRRVLAVKNGVLLAFASGLFVASTAVLLLVGGGRPPAWALAGGAVLLLAMAPWLHLAGNLVSTMNPRASAFTLRGGNLPALSGLVGVLVTSAAAGLFAVPAWVAVRLEAPWGMVAAWAALGIAGAAAYRRALPAQARQLAERRDELLPAVCGDDS